MPRARGRGPRPFHWPELGCPYTVDEAALRHGAGVEQETADADEAYARMAKRKPSRYREGWIPG
jgi:hypothetical protein